MKLRLPRSFASPARTTPLLLGLQIFYRLTGLVLLMVVSRRLPQGDIGLFFFAIAFAESLAPLASFSLAPLLMRRAASDPARAGDHLAAVLGFRLASAPLYLLVTPLAGALVGGLPWGLIATVALFILLENLYVNTASFFLARDRVVYDVAIGVTVQTVFMVVFLLGMYLAPTLDTLLGAFLLRGAALACAGLLVAHVCLGPLRVAWDAGIIRAGLPFVSISFLHLLRTHLETLLLGFLTAAGSVAVFNLAFRTVASAQFVPVSFASALFPRLAASGFDADNRIAFRRSAMMLSVLALAAMGVVLVAARPLCTVLFGQLADDVAPLLRLLALQLPLGFGTLFASSALIALGCERRVLVATTIALCVSAVGSLMLIPRLGAVGAVAAHITSSVVELATLGWWLRRALQPRN